MIYLGVVVFVAYIFIVFFDTFVLKLGFDFVGVGLGLDGKLILVGNMLVSSEPNFPKH